MSSLRSNPADSLRSTGSNRSNILEMLKEAPPPRHHKNFSFLYTLVNHRSHQFHAVLFKQVISTVIVLDLLSFILETDDIWKDYHYIFQWMESASSCIFLLEFLARLWTCVERPRFRQLGPVMGRLEFLMSSRTMIDALATLPWFLEPLVGIPLPRLTYLRFLRLLRITKIHAGMRAIDAVWRVVYYNREILYVAAFICILLVMTTGVALYYLRPPPNGTAADEDFESILKTMYLSTLMLTGQGGPEGDLPWYTKSVVLMTSIVSIAVFAIPGAMFTWGFEAEAERMAKRSHALRVRRESGTLDVESDDYSTDEEYQKLIGRWDDDDSQDGVNPEILKQFMLGDEDGDGTMTLKEFVNLSTQQSIANLNAQAGAAGDNSPVLTGMMCRVQQLEKEVKANSDKLDKILELLESKKDK